MALSAVAIAALALGGVSASEYKPHKKAVEPATPALDQLETARLTQAAQRVEFGVEGDASAFKFSFSDPVRPGSACHASKDNFSCSPYASSCCPAGGGWVPQSATHSPSRQVTRG